jgi:hypothetical protein
LNRKDAKGAKKKKAWRSWRLGGELLLHHDQL